MSLSPLELAQLKANFVELHRELGVYEEFIMSTGAVDHGRADGVSEIECIYVLQAGIEKRVAALK